MVGIVPAQKRNFLIISPLNLARFITTTIIIIIKRASRPLRVEWAGFLYVEFSQ